MGEGRVELLLGDENKITAWLDGVRRSPVRLNAEVSCCVEKRHDHVVWARFARVCLSYD